MPLTAQEERCALYQEAEQILIDEARLIPLVSTTQWWIIQVKWDEARFYGPMRWDGRILRLRRISLDKMKR
ncbi:hypothetical protein KFU94_14025 [Chloroflexi bacterium TSY]|nr:hypothetical protein [Chloroflexi bacterium TSY]